MDAASSLLQSPEVSPRPSRYKKIAVIFLVLLIAAGIIFVARKRGKEQEIKPLDAGLFDPVEQDIDAFSEDASFFNEQETDLEEINTAYETQ
ncbi:MAG: hypothetical protein G01um101433_566 [Parcubacteria group bacterium Gr01-1014_33]|nr:MAG: hypothetical protein G01um101433_566 [Parcubacteria group bacterium Gr01-1014_33]